MQQPSVQQPASRTPGVDEVVRTAARWVHEGRRVDMQLLAQELGMSRVTLYRKVGGRSAVLGEAIWHLTERTWALVEREHDAQPPTGGLRCGDLLVAFNTTVAAHRGMRRLLDEEPEMALQVLTDPQGRVQPRNVAHLAALIAADRDAGRLEPIIDTVGLAYALVRLGESFLYADVIAMRVPDVAAANRLQQALLDAGRPRR